MEGAAALPPPPIARIDDQLLVEILVRLAQTGPAKSLAACAQVAQQWCAAASDERVWAHVYGRLFNTQASVSDEGHRRGHGSTAVMAAPWRTICQRRFETAGLVNSLRAPLPAEPGAQPPLHSRVVESALDPMRGTHDKALASPQTRRIARFVYEHDDDDELSEMMEALGIWIGGSACMVASARPLSPLPALEALSGRRVAYFECRFRGGGSIGILGPEVFQLSLGRMHLGWRGHSIGYHSDDGGIYRNFDSDPAARYTVADYGPQFGSNARAGDVVGCALDLDRQNLSFFLNGVHLGRACDTVPARVSDNEGRDAPAHSATTIQWCPGFALHEEGDQADMTMGLGGFFSGDMEMKLLADRQLLDAI